MPELQRAVVELVVDLLGAEFRQTPEWLVRPGRTESDTRWPLIRAIYRELTGLELPEVMRSVERRTVDAVLKVGDDLRVFEFDESQHFNKYRALTLRQYPKTVRVAFPVAQWIEASEKKQKLEGGGFAIPRPPLFPGDGGRHKQRAFRDALCDILPPLHGCLPTLRIADFEVKPWIRRQDASDRLKELLEKRLQLE